MKGMLRNGVKKKNKKKKGWILMVIELMVILSPHPSGGKGKASAVSLP